MYESPIRLLTQQLETHMREQHDKQIFEAIQKFGVDVDRDELIKALAYDRNQYDKGYADGRADAQRWISVEERLPENMQMVIGFTPCDGYMFVGYYVDDQKWKQWYIVTAMRSTKYMTKKVTHWMPLPQMPKEV